MGTGEGKSLIIAMLAAYYVMKGSSRVNVLVDNLSLLERDFSTFDSLFKEFGISACSAANQQTVEPSVQVSVIVCPRGTPCQLESGVHIRGWACMPCISPRLYCLRNLDVPTHMIAFVACWVHIGFI